LLKGKATGGKEIHDISAGWLAGIFGFRVHTGLHAPLNIKDIKTPESAGYCVAALKNTTFCF
jgi:hypothetical protein